MRALVTGAGRGIGRAVALALVERGWSVVAAIRDPAAAPPGTSAERLDVADGASIAALAARWSGPLDLLVNNSGVALDGFDAEVVRATLAVNLLGALALTDALLPFVPDGGRVVMVSSGLGELAGVPAATRARFTAPGLDRAAVRAHAEAFRAAVAAGRHGEEGWPSSAYRVSKVGLNAVARLLADELRPRRIAVNAVCPGWVRTDMGGPGASRSAAEGAASVLATALAEPTPTGGFFRDGRPIAW